MRIGKMNYVRGNLMTVYRLLILLSALLLPIGPLLAEDKVPHEINGFRLGSSIEEYDFITYRNFLKEVLVEDIGGFRKGYISYGVCKWPGEIVKIKMKYKDSSHKYYKRLLKSYKKKFGKPEEFTGDSFGIVLAWKWRFTDENNNKITLTLQHNLKNTHETIGNMVKLSMPERIQIERECFNKQCETSKVECPVSMQSEDWENMIPR